MYIKIKNKRGQSTVEYVLLVTAVVAVIIVFLVSGNSPFKTQLNATLNSAVQGMSDKGQTLGESHTSPASNSSTAPSYSVGVNP